MASKQTNAVASLEHVIINVPQWKRHVTDIATYSAGRHGDFVAEYSRLVQQVKARRKKSASIASLRSSNEDHQVADDVSETMRSPQPSELAEISPFEAGNRFIYAQAHRKRKPGTSMRSHTSDFRACKSKQMVVIYYDSHIQTELEKLVKSFGAARNTLRKGRNDYTAARGFALPSLSRRYENLDNLLPSAASKGHPRLPKASSEISVVSKPRGSNGEEAFATTDKELEQIQALCETAAHQVIRNGDCKVELEEAASKLDALLAMAESALDNMKAEKQRRDEENASMSDATSTQSTLCEKPSLEAMTWTHKLMPPVVEPLEALKRPPLPITISAPCATLSADTIEVDDGDDDSSLDVDLNITNYRAAGHRQAV